MNFTRQREKCTEYQAHRHSMASDRPVGLLPCSTDRAIARPLPGPPRAAERHDGLLVQDSESICPSDS